MLGHEVQKMKKNLNKHLRADFSPNKLNIFTSVLQQVSKRLAPTFYIQHLLTYSDGLNSIPTADSYLSMCSRKAYTKTRQ